MACPNCDHTMQNLGADDRRLFWCPRCGTIREEREWDNKPIDSAPMWVEKLRREKLFGVNVSDGILKEQSQ